MENEKLTIRINGLLITRAIKIALSLAALIFAYDLAISFHTNHIQRQAERLFDEELPALALDELEPYRQRFVQDGRGCSLLLSVYGSLKSYEKMEWGYEACRHNKVNVFEVPYTKALLLLERGDLDDSVSLLRSIKSFHRTTVYHRLVDILKHLRRTDEALREVEEGNQAFPDSVSLKILAMDLYGDLGRWSDADRFAKGLRAEALSGRDNNLKSHVLTVLNKAGDKDTLAAMMTEINQANAARTESSPGKSMPDTTSEH